MMAPPQVPVQNHFAGTRVPNGEERTSRPDDIAVVGMALRIPGANSPEQFWTNIVRGVDCLTRTPTEALEAAGVREELRTDPRYVPSKPLLHDVEYFDAEFFNMTPAEAERTDPSQRLFFECAWEAMERAGIAPGRTAPVVGVFGGAGTSPGASYFAHNLIPRDEDLDDPTFAIPARLGNFSDFLSTRVSFALDLVGPSFGVQAACATSLFAVHLAKESIRRGECTVALAGGTSVAAQQTPGYLAGVKGMLSSNGVVKTFDADADGTVFGSGVGVVALERLEDALAAGHPIHAVIRGSGTSNDGAPPGKASFVAPSSDGQTLAIAQAIEDAGINPETIGYVEVHGTGTRLGDPIEVASMTEVFRRFTQKEQFCAMGSVKPNVGHLRQAAGVVGLIKACLALEHRVLPPSIHFDTPNPRIDFDNSPFYVPTETRSWERPARSRRAAVSAFGFGGTNAHVVLEEPPESPGPEPSRRPQLLVVSARTESALDRRLADLGSHIDQHPELSLPDVAHTLKVGRKAFAHRAAIVADGATFSASSFWDPERLIRGELPDGSADRYTIERVAGGMATVCLAHDLKHQRSFFVFPGQGAQRPGMGQQLHATEKVYGTAVDHCAELLQPYLCADIRNVLYPGPETDEVSAVDALRQTANAQSALFVVEYAMAQLFLSWGVEPQALLGHSIGEYVAACLAGVFSLPDALKLVATRGKLMQQCEPGAMLAVYLSEDEVRARLSDGLELAAVNASALSVVSGTASAIDDLVKQLEADHGACKRLLTSHAFHSRMMDPALEDFRNAFDGITLNVPQIPFIANVTGEFITADEATDPHYWVRQMRETVRFSDGVATLRAAGYSASVQLLPGRTKSGLVEQQLGSKGAAPVRQNDSKDDVDEQLDAMEALGRLWVGGATVNWSAVDSAERRQTVILPTYPFQRRRYWLEPSTESPPTRDYSADPSMYDVVWREAPLENEPPPATEGPWLVFHDGGALGERLVAHLQQKQARVASVLETDGDVDLVSVLRPLAESHPGSPIRIVHLGLVTGSSGTHNTTEAFDFATERGFYPFIALAQAAHRLRIAGQLRIVVAADSLIAIDGEAGELHSEKSVIFGPCRVIPQELPGISMRAVDIPLQESGCIPNWLTDAILGEALAADDASVVALRPDSRFVEGYGEIADLSLGRMRLREGGTVLITGGMGGLGLKVAADLYDKARARLVLTSRWKAPPREQWQQRAHDDDKVGRALKEILALEGRGAQVLIVTADTSDAESLRAAVEEARVEFGTINGVVHAAGVIDDGPVLTKTRESAEKVFGAKVRGAYALERLFAEEPLDFVVHFSSQAACMPGPGRIDYTAANSVLDALARRAANRGSGLHCSVGWGAWREVGMAARLEAARTTSATLPDAVEPLHHPLVQFKRKIEGGRYIYGGTLRPREQWILDEHRFHGRALMPAVGIIECVRAAFSERCANGFGVELSELTFLRPLFVEEEGREFEIDFFDQNDSPQFELRSRADPERSWTVHATGRVASLSERPASSPGKPPQLNGDKATPLLPPPRGAHPIVLGEHWNCLQGCETRGDLTVMHLRLPDGFREDLGEFGVHPGMLDAALTQTAERFVPGAHPFSFRSVRLYKPLTHELFAEGRHRVIAGAELFDVRLFDDTGAALIEIEGFSKLRIRNGEQTSGDDGPLQDSSQAFRLLVTQPGVLSSLRRAPLPERPPGPGEVRIDVAAAGLNFRDVLSALGQLPGHENGVGQLGSECSGWVSAVGEGVKGLQVGDPVLALARETLASHVAADARLAVRIPGNLSFEEAAGIPITFLTADYALNTLARLAEGERVLIHSATGGVGLAAVQLAQKVGAEVFGTAGSPEKREYLREIGVEHVMDSRSLDFVEGVRERTGGEGVDVVLNSLAGDFIPASIGLLKPFGRFLEIGKRDIYAHMDLDLYPFHKNLAYFVIDLGLLMTERPTQLRSQFRDLMRRFEQEELKPAPTTVFPISDPAAGFGHLARANHIGKAVFQVRHDERVSSADGRDHFREMFGEGISLAGGLNVFRRLLSSDEAPTHVLVVPRRLEADQVTSVRPQAASSQHRGRPQLSTSLVAPSTQDEETLVQVWQDVLGVAPIGVNDDFFQLGGNSMTALQLTYTAGQRLGVSLPDTAVFVHPTVAELAEAIRGLRSESQESDVAELLEEVESLDAEEISRLLDDVDAHGTR